MSLHLVKKGSPAWLWKRSRRGFRGYPIGTVAFYGPTATVATKVVVGIATAQGKGVDLLKKWFSENDVRQNEKIGLQIAAFLRGQRVKSISMAERIIGCPHEEGIDYPEGQSCPQCPFWAERDRFTHERIH